MDLEKLKKIFNDDDDETNLNDDDEFDLLSNKSDDYDRDNLFFKNKITSKKDLFSKKFIDNKEDVLKQKQIIEQKKQEKWKQEHEVKTTVEKNSNNNIINETNLSSNLNQKQDTNVQNTSINQQQTNQIKNNETNNKTTNDLSFSSKKLLNETNNVSEPKYVSKNFINDSSLVQIIESLLYVVGKEGISISDISKLIDLSTTKIKNIIDEITVQKAQDIYSGLCIINEANRYKMVTKTSTANIINNLVNQKYQTKKRRMNKACLEVLSIIAYNQPCSKKTIDTIRKKDSSSILRTLTANELVSLKISNNMNLYSVTKKFLETFNLKSLSDLPKPKKSIDLDSIVE